MTDIHENVRRNVRAMVKVMDGLITLKASAGSWRESLLTIFSFFVQQYSGSLFKEFVTAHGLEVLR